MPAREASKEGSGGLSQTADVEEIFFLFNARDEREPH